MAKQKKPVFDGSPRQAAIARIQSERGQGHETRRYLYQRLSRSIGRPVVTFFTSFRFPVMIEDDDANVLEDVLRQSDLSRGLVLVISSPGGDGEAAERIVNLCRNYSGTGDYWAVVPGKAKSAATMICFGASRVYMGPSSELGPVDPQIIMQEDETWRQYSAHNLVTSYDKLFNDAVATTGHLEPYLQQLQNYDARDIQKYRESIELAEDIGVKILSTGMMSGMKEDTIRKKIARFLLPQETKSHGRPIFRDEARNCGIRVRDVDTSGERWDLVYELYMRTNGHVSNEALKCIESAESSFTVPTPKVLRM